MQKQIQQEGPDEFSNSTGFFDFLKIRKNRKRKIVAFIVMTIFVSSMFVTVEITSPVSAEAPSVNDALKPNVDLFLDLVGDVNFTHHPDHSSYEGKGFSTHSSSQVVQKRIKFAITFNGMAGGYWILPDGSIPDSTFDPNARFVSLYNYYDALENGEDITGKCTFGICISLESPIPSVSAVEYTHPSTNPNQTLTDDRFSSYAPTKDELNPNAYQLARGNSTNLIDTSLIDVQNTADKYDDYHTELTDLSQDEQKLYKAETDDDFRQKLYYTANLTSTIYEFLARYIEDNEDDYDPRTIKITHDTENVTSTVMSTYITKETQDKAREILDEELINAGLETPSGGFSDWVARSTRRAVDTLTSSYATAAGTTQEELYDNFDTKFEEGASSDDKAASHMSAFWDAVTGESDNVDDALDEFETRAGEATDDFIETAGNIIEAPFSLLSGLASILMNLDVIIIVAALILLTLLGIWVASKFNMGSGNSKSYARS